jgi:two-component system, chemotaxis family, response regulator Rcp1
MTNECFDILMVDDNPADVDLTREALDGSHRPYRLQSASDGEEALRLLSHKGAACPDLLVLDLNLPRKDGRQVLAEIKRNPQLSTIPVVVFTTSRASSDVLCSYELGANCYVRKPGTLPEFLATVRGMSEFWLRHAMLPQKEKS